MLKLNPQVFHMAEDEEKKEIVVRAPSKPVTPPEKKAEKAMEEALEGERFGVLQVSRRVGELFSASVLITGILLLCFFAYAMFTSEVNWMITSSEITFLGLIVWTLAAIVNIIGGLFLIGSQ
jgi:hypothetical protein